MTIKDALMREHFRGGQSFFVVPRVSDIDTIRLFLSENVPEEYKHIVGQKAFETATKLDALVPVTINGETKTRAEHFEGKLPNFVKHMKKWGLAGTVKNKDQSTPKMGNRGITCMFVGYATNHSGDC